VVYHVKDAGLPRPGDEVLDLILMLLNRCNPSSSLPCSLHELEAEMEFLFPDPSARSRMSGFPAWLFEHAIPKVLGPGNSKPPSSTSTATSTEKITVPSKSLSSTSTSSKKDQKITLNQASKSGKIHERHPSSASAAKDSFYKSELSKDIEKIIIRIQDENMTSPTKKAFGHVADDSAESTSKNIDFTQMTVPLVTEKRRRRRSGVKNHPKHMAARAVTASRNTPKV
jgi:uncharacterized protein YlaN (UPF0358 family)